MLEHDHVILDDQQRPLISFGPRKLDEGDSKSVVGCAPSEAQFWGIYSHPHHDAMASHMLDAHDQVSATLAAGFIYQSLRTNNALVGLLDQLEGIGIYEKGEDEGQWAGTEGLSFKQAEQTLSEKSKAIFAAKDLGDSVKQPTAPGEYTLTEGRTDDGGTCCDIYGPEGELIAEEISRSAGKTLLDHLNRNRN